MSCKSDLRYSNADRQQTENGGRAKHIAKVASVVPHDVVGKCVACLGGLATERRDTLQGHGKTRLR